MSSIQGQENTLLLPLSRRFEDGLIRGPERHFPWILGPTNTRLSGQLTGMHAEPTLAQHLERPREGGARLVKIKGRTAQKRPAGLLPWPLRPSFSCMLSLGSQA